VLAVDIFVAVVVVLAVCHQAPGYLQRVETTQLLWVLVVATHQTELHQVLLVQYLQLVAVLVEAVTDLVAHILAVMVAQEAERLVVKAVDYPQPCRAEQELLVKEMLVVQTILVAMETVVVVVEQVLLELLQVLVVQVVLEQQILFALDLLFTTLVVVELVDQTIPTMARNPDLLAVLVGVVPVVTVV
jgi:hypothetical protein